MKRPTENEKKRALALAFGVSMSDSVVSGIPGGVPGLGKALTCGDCRIKLARGVPKQFATVMTDEQKKAFKNALKEK